MRPQPDFVRAVMQELGLSQTDLGVALKKPNAYQTVHGWITGRLKLGYDDTIEMLELCGWLNMESDARERAGLSPDPLRAIGGALVNLEDSMRTLLERVPERRVAQPKRGAASSKRRR